MRVLVTGGTGAMGSHLSSLLAKAGHDVCVTTRRFRDSQSGIRYLHGDAKSRTFLESIISQGWDVIVDFMKWNTGEFAERIDALLGSTKQYVFLSSYRVYADSTVIDEESLRLLDVVDDPDYLATDEYALMKARSEDMLFGSGRSNWTIVRPAITYDGNVGRLQLGALEAPLWLWRAKRRIPVPMPDDMALKQTTMTWGGDVARMIAGLVGNEKALGETFTAATSEHISWADVAETYKAIVPLEIAPCDLVGYERARGNIYQIRYDRMYDRVVDNSKILAVTGLQQEELTPMREGLARELNVLLANESRLDPPVGLNARFDRIIGSTRSLGPLLKESSGRAPLIVSKYVARRFF